MAEFLGQPAYQQVADDLRKQISEGRIQVGEAVPSAAKLRERYAVSSTVVQRAINELRSEGLLIGQPGKAVFVKATPEAIADESVNLRGLADQLAELRSELHELDGAAASADVTELRAEMIELRRQLATVQTNLIDLYGRVGQPYPHDSAASRDRADASRRDRRAG